MGREPRKLKVAVYPNGVRFTIRRVGRMWEWKRGCCSSHLLAALEHVAEEGGYVELVPNPAYRPGTRAPDHLIRDLLGNLGRRR